MRSQGHFITFVRDYFAALSSPFTAATFFFSVLSICLFCSFGWVHLTWTQTGPVQGERKEAKKTRSQRCLQRIGGFRRPGSRFRNFWLDSVADFHDFRGFPSCTIFSAREVAESEGDLRHWSRDETGEKERESSNLLFSRITHITLMSVDLFFVASHKCIVFGTDIRTLWFFELC